MASKFNSPDTEKLEKTIDKLKEEIETLQEIGLPSIKDVPKKIWKEIKNMILTERQIAKKILMIQGQLTGHSLSEEDAQLMVYGKVYYKNGKLYDNDRKDPSCVSTPGEYNNREASFYFSAPIDKNHPLWEKITETIKNLKENFIQLGIKIGEFLAAIPRTIFQIITSLIALISAAIILPFGAGLPTAITAVQTMVETIKDLQSKTADILPLIGILNLIGLILPKSAQGVIATITSTILLILGITTALTSILGMLNKVLQKLGLKKKDMEEQSKSVKVEMSADPQTVKKGETVKLSINATGGDWDYKHQLYGPNNENLGTVNATNSQISISPTSSGKYTCKTTDGTGKVTTSSVNITVI